MLASDCVSERQPEGYNFCRATSRHNHLWLQPSGQLHSASQSSATWKGRRSRTVHKQLTGGRRKDTDFIILQKNESSHLNSNANRCIKGLDRPCRNTFVFVEIDETVSSLQVTEALFSYSSFCIFCRRINGEVGWLAAAPARGPMSSRHWIARTSAPPTAPLPI